MFGKYTATIKKIIEFAGNNPDIEAILLVGSYARKVKPADNYSDLDVIIFTHDPDKYIDNSQWLSHFGNVVCTFTETTFNGNKERRVLYDDNRDIDFPIESINTESKSLLFKNPDVAAILRNGYTIIYNTSHTLEQKIENSIKTVHKKNEIISRDELENEVHDFHYHIIWAAKKLKRKELWIAVNCINKYITNLLLNMIKHYVILCDEKEVNWYGGRFLEDYIPEKYKQRLKNCFCRYDASEAIEALHALHDLYREISQDVYKKLGLKYDKELNKIFSLCPVFQEGDCAKERYKHLKDGSIDELAQDIIADRDKK